MKLFKSLLVAPATLGLLAPLNAFANEVNLNNISNYSEGEVEIDLKSFDNYSSPKQLLAGGEGLVEDFDGGFSETTSASFSVDEVLGSIDGNANDSTTFDFQYNIGLTTSFTGEDSLDIAIDSGTATQSPSGAAMGFDSGGALTVDGVVYSFPLGDFAVLVGDSTDISAAYTGACAYTAFHDTMSNCGTGNTVGAGGQGVTAASSYAFDSGFSLAAGVSSPQSGIMVEESSDLVGIEAAYTADSYGVAVAYASLDNAADADTSYWGINVAYTPDSEVIPSISVGFEIEETSGTDAEGYFLGLTWDEVGPGSASLGVGSNGNFGDAADDLLIYEASYSYPVNDSLTITPGVFIAETGAGADDETGLLVKSSFAF